MRDIKFRAFSTRLNVMMPIMTMWELVESDGRGVDCRTLVIMQFTGLKDKNDTEIYEGDIVRDKYEDIGIVRYENGALIILKTCGWFKENHGAKFEVIGNIYENPELLHPVTPN